MIEENPKISLTLAGLSALLLGVKPFKLRVTWLCWKYLPPAPVEVELEIMGKKARTIHTEADPDDAIIWAIKWLADRGFTYQTFSVPESFEAGDDVVLHPVVVKET